MDDLVRKCLEGAAAVAGLEAPLDLVGDVAEPEPVGPTPTPGGALFTRCTTFPSFISVIIIIKY